MNDLVFLNYIENFLVPTLGGRPTLFSLDLMGSHKTPAVLDKLKSHNITPSLIPGGCTSLVQPLAIAINKSFKEIMRKLTDNAIFAMESADTFYKWSVCDRLILTTTCVGDAFYRFHLEKANIIQCVFRKVSLSLPIDGSYDFELDIKGFIGLEIGNWIEECEAIDEDAKIPETRDIDEGIDFILTQK